MIWAWHEDKASLIQDLTELELKLELADEQEDRFTLRRKIKDIEEILEIESSDEN